MPRREYGEGSVQQHHTPDCPRPGDCDCRWRGVLEAGYTTRGTRRRITVTGRTEAEARRRLRNRKQELARTGPTTGAGDNRRRTVASWGETWLQLRERTVRPSTYTSDRTALRRYIAPTIGRVRLVDLTPAHLRQVATAARQGAGAPTALRVHRALTKMLRDAAAEGHTVPTTVFDASPPVKAAPRPTREALTTTDAIAILDHASRLPNGTRWLIGFLEGTRQGETLGLTWDRVDLEAGWLDISWQLQALPYRTRFDRASGFRIPDDYEARHLVGRFHLVRPKSARGGRHVPLVPTAVAALRVWRENSPGNPHDLVWARENGWPIDKAADATQWRHLQDAAEVRHPTGRHYVVHELRNTTATLLAELGVDESIRVAIMGHSSIAVTRGYVTARGAAMRSAIEDVAGQLAQGGGEASP